MAIFDLDTIFDDKPMHGGEYGLWLRVTTEAVVDLLKWRSDRARDFLFDENIFVDFVAAEMGFSCDGFREKIRAAVTRVERDRREPWQDRIRGTVTETAIVQPVRP